MVHLPVTCPKPECRSTRLRVYKTDENKATGKVERHRLCLTCGREWVTESDRPIERFLRNKPSLRRRNKVAV